MNSHAAYRCLAHLPHETIEWLTRWLSTEASFHSWNNFFRSHLTGKALVTSCNLKRAFNRKNIFSSFPKQEIDTTRFKNWTPSYALLFRWSVSFHCFRFSKDPAARMWRLTPSAFLLTHLVLVVYSASMSILTSSQSPSQSSKCLRLNPEEMGSSLPSHHVSIITSSLVAV